MPESFESMLATMAQEAAASAKGPAAAEIRQRGAQRTTRRRLALSLAAFTAVCGVLAGGVAGRFLGAGPTTSVAPATSFSAPLPSPSGVGALPQPAGAGPSASPSGSSVADPGLRIGIWTRSDGTPGYLIIYPMPLSGSKDWADIAIGEPGSFPLCVGRMSVAAVGSAHAISGVSCPNAAAEPMSLSYGDSVGKSVVLHESIATDGQWIDIPYSVQAMSTEAIKTVTDVPQILGTWVAGSGRITVTEKGVVNWTVQSQGVEQSGSGKPAGSFEGGMIVSGTCSSGVGVCSMLQLTYDAKHDQLIAIGGDGPVTFSRKG